MSDLKTCPQKEQLQSLLAGTLSAEDQEPLSRHIEACESCQQTLEHLAATSWEERVRHLRAGETPPESALQEVIAEAGQQAPSAETQAETSAAPVDELPFLEPPRQPGHLGRFAHYEIHEIVGSGGMGVVLKAFDEKLHRVVAIKFLSPELAVSTNARRRFSREAKSAAAVAHGHVVTIHAVDDDHRPPYLVMEFIDGKSLQARIDDQGPLALTDILRIGMQTACGLAAAHKQGLIHRDIKPANILLENGVERVKITDFGLARAADDASITQSGVIAGTPMYMSPEQAAGEPVDQRSDLFSLGSVLYAMATGKPPFRASGTMAVMKRVIEEVPRPIRESNPEIPEWLCQIIEKLHAKKPEERFSSASEVAELLEQHLAHLQQPEKVPQPAPVQSAATMAARDEQENAAAASDWKQRPLVNLAATLALVIAAVALWFPLSWQVEPDGEGPNVGAGAWVAHVELGVLQPLRLTWESSDAGFWLSFTRVRGFPLFLTLTLTVAALVVARQTLRRSRLFRQQAQTTTTSPKETAQHPRLQKAIIVAAVLVFAALLFSIGIWMAPSLTGYFANQAVLTMGGMLDPDLEKIIIKQGETPIAVVDQFQHRSAVLPAGEYVLEIVARPGYQPTKILIERERKLLFRYEGGGSWQRLEKPVYALELKAGDYVSLAVAVEKAAAVPPSPPPSPAEVDLAALQGEWVARLGKLAGKPFSQKDIEEMSISFKDGNFEFRQPGVSDSGTFRIEAEKKQLLLFFEGKKVPVRCAYRLERGRLRLDFAGLLDPDAAATAQREYLRLADRTHSRNNLYQLGIAMHMYHDANKALPRAGFAEPPAKDGKPLLSWRVALLPYVDQEKLYRQFKLDEPWDSEHNKKLIEKMPKIFEAPGIKTKGLGLTHYRVFVGPDTVFEPLPDRRHGVQFGEIQDGLSNTLMMVEAAEPVIWTKPDELPFDAKQPLSKLGVYGGGIHVLFCDGTVKTLSPAVSEEALRGLITRNGGEQVSAPFLSPDPPQAPPLYLELERRNTPPEAIAPIDAETWVQLFNGKDLTSWKTHPAQPGEWTVEKDKRGRGLLVGRKGKSHLFTERSDFENFHLRAEVKINDKGNSGVFFRSPFTIEGWGGKIPLGYEAQINSTGDPYKTGSLFMVDKDKVYFKRLTKTMPVNFDQWFLLEVIAEGNRLRVRVNGEELADCLDDHYTKGHLALQVYDENSVVHFRKIEIKEF